jgi:ribulose-phosphate 3-epimerase
MERDLQTIAAADAVHVDIMDSHFVPNLTFGVAMTQRIQDTSPVPLDVHLMISDPLTWAPRYAATGAECVTFHVEATDNPRAVIDAIHEAGGKAGISVKPNTPVEPYLDLIPDIEQFLVMTVEPGFGGQAFMPEVLPKVTAVAKEAATSNPGLWIQVDGGIGTETIEEAVRHGANTLVAGSAVFRPGVTPAEAITTLRQLAQTAQRV